MDNINKVRQDVNQSFQPEYSRHQIQHTMKRYNDQKDPLSKKTHYANEAFTADNTKSGLFSSIASGMFQAVNEALKFIFNSSF